MRAGLWTNWKRTAAVSALLGALSLSLTGCGEDPAPEPEDPTELDADVEDDDVDPNEKPVIVRGDQSVRPDQAPPSGANPPKHWKHLGPAENPLVEDSGAKKALPTGPVDPVAAVQDMNVLYAEATAPVPRFLPGGRDVNDRSRLEDLKKFRKASDAVKSALERLINVGSRYIDTVTDAKAQPVPRYQFAYALTTLADKSPLDRAQSMRLDAIDQFKKYLGAPEEQARYIADAEYLLGISLLKVGDSYGPTTEEALEHLEKGAALLRGAGRREEAGLATFNVLATLIDLGREQEANERVPSLQANEFDFGARTKTIRRLVRRAALHPGAVMPEFEGLVDSEGKAITLAEHRGSPVLVHLFQAGLANGSRSNERDVETILVPLSREFGPKGLKLIGSSLDFALTPEKVEQIRKNWEEWGKDGEVHDGSLESVRSWCDAIGMDWTLHHDGKWFAGAVAEHCGVNGPYAFLLDGEGVIRWRGKAPYEGLEDTVKKLIK